MFLPMLLPIPVESKALEQRVGHLEQALSHSLVILESLSKILESKFGSDVLDPETRRFISGKSSTDLENVVQAIDQHVTAGAKPEAARQIRDAFGCSWDDAHQVTRHWMNYSRQQKICWLRLASAIQSLTE